MQYRQDQSNRFAGILLVLGVLGGLVTFMTGSYGEQITTEVTASSPAADGVCKLAKELASTRDQHLRATGQALLSGNCAR